jgi:response regulator NasT
MSSPVLRVLAADEDKAALDGLAAILADLGHQVVARAVALGEVERAVAEDQPDVALVKVHSDEEHALDLIQAMADGASCPVIALSDDEDPEFAEEAAERGVSAYVSPITADGVHAALEVARHRHAEVEELETTVDQLESALGRRAVIERAKGILMERHELDETDAFEVLRTHARSNNRKVLDVAREVTEGGRLSVGGQP